MVTEGDKSFTPGGKTEGGLPMEDLWGGWGTDRLVLLLRGDTLSGGTCIFPLGGGACC